jgi:hypothetical protein
MASRSVRITRDVNRIDELIRALKELDNYSVEIGIFASDDSFYAMIANVHEFGITIKPKGEALTIPTAAAEGRKASDIPGLFRPRGTSILAIEENGELITMFYLVKSVTIPERSFVRSTFDEKSNEWFKFMEGMIEKVVSFKMDADTLFNRLGARIAADIQNKITTLRSPANKKSTIENKGSSNPLADSGGLRARVTWKVVRK